MTRTRPRPASSASRHLRNGTREQTKKSLTIHKMRAKKPPKKWIQSLARGLLTEKTSTALPMHQKPGFKDLAKDQVDSNTRMCESESDNDSLGDEGLPEVEFNSTTAKTKVKELVPGTVVWAKSPFWPFWPAVLLKVFPKERKALIVYFDETHQRTRVSLRSMTPFFGSSRSEFIEAGKAGRDREGFITALDRAEDYLIKQGLGKTAESSANVSFSLDVSTSAATTVSPAKMPLSHDTSGDTSHDMSGDTSPDAQPSASLPPSSNNFLSSDEELLIGHPISHPNQMQELTEDCDLIERRRMWKYTENRLLKYIRRGTTKTHLLDIYHGKKTCERQRLFQSIRNSDRQKLRLMAGIGPITDEELESELTSFLRDLYVEHCMKRKDDIPNTSYITEVWLPEAIIFAIQKTRRVGRRNAEKLFYSEGVQSMVDLGEDMPVVSSLVSQAWSGFEQLSPTQEP